MSEVNTDRPFPVCIDPADSASDVGDGTEYPLGYTWEELFDLLWKMKRLSATGVFNVTLSYTYGEPPDEYVFEDVTAGTSSINPTHEFVENNWTREINGDSIGDEEFLVCPRKFWLVATEPEAGGSFFFTDTEDPDGLYTSVYIDALLIDLSTAIKLHDGKYWPSIQLYLYSYGLQLYSYKDDSARPGAIWSEFGTFTLLGISCPLYVDINPENYGSVSEVSFTGSVAITMSADADWAFASS